MLVGMGVGRIFSRGPQVDFSKSFSGVAKVVKFLSPFCCGLMRKASVYEL